MTFRLGHVIGIAASSALLGAGTALIVWSSTVVAGTPLWSRLLAAGSALSIAAAVLACVTAIVVRRRRPQG